MTYTKGTKYLGEWINSWKIAKKYMHSGPKGVGDLYQDTSE